MSIPETLCALLEDKRQAFLTYEKETEALIVCDVETAQAHMNQRSLLIKEIDLIDKKIEGVLSSSADRELLGRAVKAKSLPAELTEEYLPIYEQAQLLFAVMNRVKMSEPQAANRLDQLKNELLNKIKENNKGTGAQVSKYYNSTFPDKQRPNFLSEKI